MLGRIRNVATKEFIHLTRNWLLLVFIILGPTMELVLLARATGQGLTHLPTVVVDQDDSRASREIVAALDNTEELDVIGNLDSPAQLDAWMDGGQAALAVILPQGLEAELSSATDLPQVQVIADGSNSMAGGYALNAATGALNAFAVRQMASTGRSAPMIDLRTHIRYNPNLNSRYFAITAQLGFVIYQIALVVAVASLTRERELGTFERLLVTPVRRLELIIGKTIPALVIAGLDFLLMWGITVWGFQVPMRGSFALLLGLSFLFIVAEIGWGLTISALSSTQQQAALVVFVLAMIDVSFSGYIMSVERMPAALQMLSQVFPLQHYLTVIRSVMLKGATWQAMWSEALALGILSVGSIVVAAFSLHNRLD